MLAIRQSAADPDYLRRFCVHQLVMFPLLMMLSLGLKQQMIPRSEPLGAGVVAENIGRPFVPEHSVMLAGPMPLDAWDVSGNGPSIRLASYSLPIGSNATVPHGWRRTVDGWQHTADWRDGRAKGLRPDQTMRAHLVAAQSRPRSLVDRVIHRLRSTSPAVIALCQVVTIGGIWFLCPTRKASHATACGPIEPNRPG